MTRLEALGRLRIAPDPSGGLRGDWRELPLASMCRLEGLSRLRAAPDPSGGLQADRRGAG